MIISDKHKYLFIEIPHTATTAISKELRTMYDGVSILRKHAHYFEFERTATEEQKDYFVFAGIRNPLDEAVSKYFKFKGNHKQKFTEAQRTAVQGGTVTNENLKRYDYLQETDADFADYFKAFYKLPYSNIINVSYENCDFIVRFENLEEDFAKALELIGLEQKRPLPSVNKTNKPKRDYRVYYTPDTIDQAKRVFGPFMQKWGYQFPPEWGDDSLSWYNHLEYHIFDFLRTFNWKYIRWSPYFYGRLFRKLR